MVDSINVMWDVIGDFIVDIAAALLDDALIPILQALFDIFFTFIFISLGSSTIGFVLIFCFFMLIFYIKYVRGAGS